MSEGMKREFIEGTRALVTAEAEYRKIWLGLTYYYEVFDSIFRIMISNTWPTKTQQIIKIWHYN